MNAPSHFCSSYAVHKVTLDWTAKQETVVSSQLAPQIPTRVLVNSVSLLVFSFLCKQDYGISSLLAGPIVRSNWAPMLTVS